MDRKRTMGEALRSPNLSEEARAFIGAGSSTATLLAPPGPTELTEPAPPSPAGPRTDTRATPAPSRRRAVPVPDPAGTISMSFRLPAAFPAALIRASMERKLRRETPCSQQEIVAEAVREWLERNGYAN